MNIEVVKKDGQWKVEFSFENQSFTQFFTLEYGGTKTEAIWMSKMLKKCFANYKKSLK